MGGMTPALRALVVFWAVLLVVLAGGAVTLELMGPPGAAPALAAAPAAVAAAAKPAEPPEEPRVRPPAPEGFAAANSAAGRDQRAGLPSIAPGESASGPAGAPAASGPVAAPEAALLEPAPDFPGAQLPRIARDGRVPMTVYARPFTLPPAQAGAPLVALMVDGLGLSELDSRQAITELPGEVDLAVSAYAPAPGPLLDLARERGHEILASLPMEPQGYPLNDEGIRALLTGADPETNRVNLQWALSRIQGYVGVTGASDGLEGERLAQTPDAFAPVAQQLEERGLLYVDPRPGATPHPPLTGRSADLVLDDPPSGPEIDAKLAQLEAIARERGSALGIAGPPRPVMVQHLAAWARQLAGRGVVLVPITALPRPSEEQQHAGAEGGRPGR